MQLWFRTGALLLCEPPAAVAPAASDGAGASAMLDDASAASSAPAPATPGPGARAAPSRAEPSPLPEPVEVRRGSSGAHIGGLRQWHAAYEAGMGTQLLQLQSASSKAALGARAPLPLKRRSSSFSLFRRGRAGFARAGSSSVLEKSKLSMGSGHLPLAGEASRQGSGERLVGRPAHTPAAVPFMGMLDLPRACSCLHVVWGLHETPWVPSTLSGTIVTLPLKHRLAVPDGVRGRPCPSGLIVAVRRHDALDALGAAPFLKTSLLMPGDEPTAAPVDMLAGTLASTARLTYHVLPDVCAAELEGAVLTISSASTAAALMSDASLQAPYLSPSARASPRCSTPIQALTSRPSPAPFTRTLTSHPHPHPHAGPHLSPFTRTLHPSPAPSPLTSHPHPHPYPHPHPHPHADPHLSPFTRTLTLTPTLTRTLSPLTLTLTSRPPPSPRRAPDTPPARLTSLAGRGPSFPCPSASLCSRRTSSFAPPTGQTASALPPPHESRQPSPSESIRRACLSEPRRARARTPCYCLTD